MLNLPDMMDEVLLLICKHLGTRIMKYDFQNDLFNLCLTSRHFYDLANPFLYQEAFPSRLGAFLRTMIDRPDLAAQITFLNLTEVEIYDDDLELLPPLAPVAMESGVRIETSSDPLTSIIDYAKQYPFGFIVDLLFTKLPSLETLEIGECISSFDGEFLFKRLESNPECRILPSLQRMSFVDWGQEDPTDATAMLPILALSGVRQLYLQRCYHADFELVDADFALEEIVLDDCQLDADDLEALIQHCPNLRSFSLRVMRHETVVAAEVFVIDVAEILGVLRMVKDQLEKLSLHVYCRIAQYEEGDQNGRVMESLTDFSNLRELEICQHDLTNGRDFEPDDDEELDLQDEEEEVNVGIPEPSDDAYRFIHKLPASLEKLMIFEARRTLLPELSKLAEEAPKVLPNLQRVATSGARFSPLVSSFKEVGIELAHISYKDLKGRERTEAESRLAFPYYVDTEKGPMENLS